MVSILIDCLQLLLTEHAVSIKHIVIYVQIFSYFQIWTITFFLIDAFSHVSNTLKVLYCPKQIVSKYRYNRICLCAHRWSLEKCTDLNEIWQVHAPTYFFFNLQFSHILLNQFFTFLVSIESTVPNSKNRSECCTLRVSE